MSISLSASSMIVHLFMRETDFKSRFKIGSEVLQSLFENGKSPLSDQFLRWKIWAQWESIVGPTVGKNSEPVGYYRGTLYLWVPHSTWMQQLVFMRHQIKVAVNRKLGKIYVKDVRLTLDRKAVPSSPEEQRQFKKIVQNLAPEEGDKA
jgi:hypothetical protein